MKNLFCTLFALFCLVSGSASEILNFKGADAAQIGICVTELSSGRNVRSVNVGKLFIPASVMKCVTAAAAVSMLPEEAPFKTTVSATGYVSDRVLHGNIIVSGVGDPTLDSRHFGTRKGFIDSVAGWVKGLEIDSIAGDIVVDCGTYPEPGVSPYWLLEDIAWEYGAGLYGFNWHDNSFSMTVDVAEGVRSMTPEIYGLEVVCDLKNGTAGQVMAMRGEDSWRLNIYGHMTGRTYSSRYSMPSPADAFHDALVDKLAAAGVVCGETVSDEMSPCGHKPLIYVSPSRDEILRSMMIKSNNLFAEGMLRALAPEKGGRGVDAALAAEVAWLKDVGMTVDGKKIADGSGLAVTNRLSPEFLCRLLAVMNRGDNAGAYARLFPLVGKEGTVKSLLADTRLKGQLALKSGSMSGVMCYVGYKLDSSGKPTHVVAVMVNGFTCRTAEVRAAIARYLLTLF